MELVLTKLKRSMEVVVGYENVNVKVMIWTKYRSDTKDFMEKQYHVEMIIRSDLKERVQVVEKVFSKKTIEVV